MQTVLQKWKKQLKSCVNDANVSFMAQKMTIDAEDEKFDEIMKQAVEACARVEPDCKIIL